MPFQRSCPALPERPLSQSPLRWLGDSPWVPGTRLYPLVPPLPVLESVKPDHLLSAVDSTVAERRGRPLRRIREHDRELEAAVERERHALQGRVGLPGLRVRGEGLGVREDVVRHEQRAGLDLVARQLEQPLVVVLLRVDEHDVEDILDRRQCLERVALEQLRGLLEPRLRDIHLPGLDLRGVGLEREHAAPEIANPGGEPDRRVAARAPDLQHLAVPLRRDEREQELPGRPGDLPSPKLPRDPFLALPGILRLEPFEHGSHSIVEHQTSTLTIPSSTTTGNVSTGNTAGSVNAAPVRMSMCEPCRGQTAKPSSASNSPSQSGPSSCEQRSSSAYSSPFRL